MGDTTYVKLSDKVGSTITIQEVIGFKFKKWDNDNRKMLVSDEWQEGYSKRWMVETDEGMLDLSARQLGDILEACHKGGVSNVNGQTFQIKSNGKEKEHIRYFFNHVREFEPGPSNVPEETSEPFTQDDDIDLSEVPF